MSSNGTRRLEAWLVLAGMLAARHGTPGLDYPLRAMRELASFVLRIIGGSA
jgi:hypothetical protein